MIVRLAKLSEALQALQVQKEECFFSVSYYGRSKNWEYFQVPHILMFPRKKWGEPRRISE